MFPRVHDWLMRLGRTLRLVPVDGGNTGLVITESTAPAAVTVSAFSADPSNPNVDLELAGAGTGGVKVGGAPVLVDRLFWTKRLLQLVADSLGGGANFTNIGFKAAPTTSGSVLAGSAAFGGSTSFVSAAVNGSVCGLISATFDYYRREWSPTQVFQFKTHTGITNIRFWFGMVASDLSAVATPTTQVCAAFSYDTARDGTVNWRAVTCDGSSATITDTGIAIAAGSLYRLRIEVDETVPHVKFYVNDVLAATHTTTLPPATTNMGHEAHATTLTNAGAIWHFARLAAAMN